MFLLLVLFRKLQPLRKRTEHCLVGLGACYTNERQSQAAQVMNYVALEERFHHFEAEFFMSPLN